MISEETKKRMSEAHKNKKQSKEQIRKRVLKLKGKKRSEEFKIKQSNLMKGNKRNLGHKMSEKSKRKISIKNKGNHYAKGAIRSEETRKKIGLANFIKIHPNGDKSPNWKGGISHKYILMRATRKKPEQCEICGAIGKICYDHNHETEKFRGWICLRCNSTLGFVKDNKELLYAMIKYLENNYVDRTR